MFQWSFPLSQPVSVPVMDIRKTRVGMPERLVMVRMGMRLGPVPCRVVLVLMMRVVHMLVCAVRRRMRAFSKKKPLPIRIVLIYNENYSQ